MITKKVLISFAKAGETFGGRKTEIVEAIEFASKNLFAKHGVHILNIDINDDNDTILMLFIPDDIAGSFSVGNHLRGISQYLLKNYPKYKELLVGKRLLSYKVLQEKNVEKVLTIKPDSIDISKVPIGTNVDFGMAVMFKTYGEYHVSVSDKGIIVTKEG